MLKRIRPTIGLKIFALIVLGSLGLIGTAALGLWELKSGLKEQKRIELRHLTELALGIIKEEEAATRTGVTLDEAQHRAAARVAALRYGSNEYFWINDTVPRMVMHPIRPELNGTDLSTTKDPNGKALFVAFADVVKREGAGWVDYAWPKPGATVPQPKLSYVVGFAPWNWVIGTGVYIDDLEAQAWAAAQRALTATGMVLLVTLVASLVMARRITGPLHRITSAMTALAAGSLDADIPGVGRRDEIGDMADAVAVFKTNGIESRRRRAEQKDVELHAAAQRRADMHRLADHFQTAVGGIIAAVSSSANELEATATTLTRTADMTQTLSSTVSAASEEASTDVQAVAAATNEMTSSIGEIGRQVQTSSCISADAVRQAEMTDARVGELSQAANRIGDVVKLITAIAEQTNLLALNATIEAARAGEAGKGFAVVAQEVKALAGQTAKATGDIASQIAGMQAATQDAVAAIKEIGGTIGRIAEIASTIAAAVEEQGAATAEISRNIRHAAEGTARVAETINHVSRGAEETGAASGQVLSAAGQLASEGKRLEIEVEKFLSTIRAA